MFKDEPEFCEIWGDLRCYLDGRLVLAHNAAFDMSVLRCTLDVYRIPYPEVTYHCTMLIAKKAWPGCPVTASDSFLTASALICAP